MTDVSFLRSRQIRVVFNALHAKSGGGVTYLRNLLPALAKDPAFELHLFVHETQFADFADLHECIRLHVFSFPTSFLRLLLWEQLLLPLLVHDVSADLVVSPANYGPLLLRRQVIVLQNSLAVGACETRWSKKIYWQALSLMTAASLLSAKAAVAVSDYVAKTAIGLPHSVRKRISVIHHGVGDLFHPGPTPRENFLLAVGDLYVQKNFETLIHAIHIVARKTPDICLKIVGRSLDLDYSQRLYALVKELGLEKNVEFHGHCPPQMVADLYRRCQVFVFPSIEESFGMPVLEAMNSGCSIACSNSAAMPEVAGDTVRYFSPTSATEMAIAIETLNNDPALRAEYTEKALKRAALFRWENSALSFGQLLKRLHSKDRARR